MSRALLVSNSSTLNHFFFICFFIFLVDMHLLVEAHIYIYSACSQDKYQPNSPFEANHESFLSSVVSSSSQASYNSFAIGNGTDSPPEASLYGLYQCRGDLNIADCSDCIQGAVTQIKLLCPESYGASLQLDGCYVRYEHFDFLGKLDTSLTYKKCGNSVSNDDVDFFRRRDVVLADLLLATGFRVSTSGMVEGFAQCMGDLGATDCSACLAEAVKQLKTLCGSVAAADVFLAQCYARYWTSGYYDYSGSIREDQTGKNVAIIIGTLVGVLILVIVLALCRKFVHR